jgi:hypothetical protein
MKKYLVTAAALLALGAPALADSITLNASVNGVLVDTISSIDGNLNVNSVSFGPDFDLNTLTINAGPSFLAPPGILSTNTLDVNQTVAGTNKLVLDIVASGLTGTGALTALLSEFSVTGLTTGWTVQEATAINGAPLSATPVFTGNSASVDVAGSATLTSPYSAEAIYTIVATGTGQFNGGIDINAGVPGPTAGAGVPGIVAALVLLGLAARRRRLAHIIIWNPPAWRFCSASQQ